VVLLAGVAQASYPSGIYARIDKVEVGPDPILIGALLAGRPPGHRGGGPAPTDPGMKRRRS